MAKRHSSTPRPQSDKPKILSCWAYLRCSTDHQDTSIDQQREALTAWAETNQRIITSWFTDEGISGNDERPDFARMIHEATTNANERPSEIVVWRLNRFSRREPTVALGLMGQLKKLGIVIHSMTEGPFDVDEPGDLLKSCFTSMQAHQDLKKLAADVTRGLTRAAKSGGLNGRPTPVGYLRVICDERGVEMRRLKPEEKFQKPRTWSETWEIDTERSKHVLKAFTDYVDADCGQRAIADRLNSLGVPAPKGGKWYQSNIALLLRNSDYTGSLTTGKGVYGKFSNMAEPVVVPNHHPAIVTQELFDRVQTKLDGRKEQHRTHRSRRKDGEVVDDLVLSGLLRCGHCGAPMEGGHKTTKGEHKPHYHCRSYAKQGSSVCSYNGIYQAPIAEYLANLLRDLVISGGQVNELTQRIKARLAERQKTSPEALQAIEERLAALDKQKARLARLMRMAEDDATAEDAMQQLADVNRERAEAERQKAELLRAAPADLDKTAEALAARIWALSAEFANAEPSRLRELLNRFVGRIELHFTKVQTGGTVKPRTETPFSHGTVELRADTDLSGLEQCGSAQMANAFSLAAMT